MKILKLDEGICLECGKREREDNPIYEIDFGTVHIRANQLCRRCMNRLWFNLDLLIKVLDEQKAGQ